MAKGNKVCKSADEEVAQKKFDRTSKRPRLDALRC